MLFHVDDLLLFAEEYQVDREKHSNRVDAPRRHNPQAAARLGPPLRLSEKAYQPREIAIGDRSLGGNERFLRFVVHVDGMVVTVTRHTSPRLCLLEGESPLSMMDVTTR